ncbi:hypothetical protein BDZ45DRAFT_87023 [Acephala macrosclerotiorum]|nr:hypothetical protein BDZ45DRAFT_87023 [Acephala macrosclerotiorum]
MGSANDPAINSRKSFSSIRIVRVSRRRKDSMIRCKFSLVLRVPECCVKIRCFNLLAVSQFWILRPQSVWSKNQHALMSVDMKTALSLRCQQ